MPLIAQQSLGRLPSSQAEAALEHLAQRVAHHWRHSRATPRERLPSPLWDQAVSLTQTLPFSRVARRLGLAPLVRTFLESR